MNKVTEVKIKLIKPQAGLIAFASVVIDGNLKLGCIGVHKKLNGDGYRLTYPTKALGEGQQSVFFPIKRHLSDAIEQAIFSQLKTVLKQEALKDVLVKDDRHCGFNAG